MSNRLVAIVGGAIATVVGGVVLYFLLPSQQAQKAATASGMVHLKCSMRGGPMNGQVYHFHIDPWASKVSWDGTALEVGHFGAQRIDTTALHRLFAGEPEHDRVSFSFNRLTMVVEGRLRRSSTPNQIPSCRDDERRAGMPAGLTFCDLIPAEAVGEPSSGRCQEVSRAF